MSGADVDDVDRLLPNEGVEVADVVEVFARGDGGGDVPPNLSEAVEIPASGGFFSTM